MSSTEDGSEDRPRGRLIPGGASGAFIVAGEVIVRGDDALARLQQIAAEQGADRELDPDLDGQWFRVVGVPDALAAVEQLRSEGYTAQPNHGFGAHSSTATCTGGGCACCCDPCGPHPSAQFMANPFMAHPFMAHPFMAHPFMAHPFMAHPFMAHPFMAHTRAHNTAIPADPPKHQVATMSWPKDPAVVIFDTGLAEGQQRPAVLPATVTGDPDQPDVGYVESDGTFVPADDYIDPVAGHGTFIAGLVERLAPGATITVEDVLSPAGLLDEWGLKNRLTALAATEPAPDFLSLSLGGPAVVPPAYLHQGILDVRKHGVVIVASAGNAATCEPFYPAAFPEVIAVGALGPDGPAPFTNYGPWVDASAPGVDLTSTYFKALPKGLLSPVPGIDASAFDGWARWSGTSFSVPVVIGALLREMALGGLDAHKAVERLLRAEHTLRIPDLGAVVNL